MLLLQRVLGVSGVALALGCASDAGMDIPPSVVEHRALGIVELDKPVDLDALAPPVTTARVLSPGIEPRSQGGLGLTLVLAGSVPLRVKLHDLRHDDGGGPCYAVHAIDSGPAETTLGVIRVHGDGRRLAVPVQTGQLWRVALAELRDGAFHEVASTAPTWQYVDWPTIDPVRNLVAFWAVDGSQPGGSSATIVVRKGTTLEQVARVAAGNTKHWPTFAADGRLVVRVLVGNARGRERIVVAGTASRDYERVGTPRCSPGGSHVAAAVRRSGKDFLWLDGHEVGPFDAVGNPRFVAEDLIGLVVRNGPDAAWHVVRAPAAR